MSRELGEGDRLILLAVGAVMLRYMRVYESQVFLQKELDAGSERGPFSSLGKPKVNLCRHMDQAHST